MSTKTIERVEDLFQAAIDLRVDERTAFLDERCDDAETRIQVERLLVAADNGDGQFLSTPVIEMQADPDQMPTLDNAHDVSELTPGIRVRYFGDYELLEEIGIGGMGVVYKARQLSLNRIVALKMVIGGRFISNKQIKQFRAEAESIANLDHAHIVPIYEMGEFNGTHYFSMKLIDGGNLAFHMSRYNQDPVAAANLMIAVARAVHHGHKHGILHRDLKPANILLDGHGSPFVSDFGLAKHVAADGGLTQPDAIMGTPSYMSPEQAAGKVKNLTVASDIYSLGAILYEMISGRPPFKAETALQTVKQVREEKPPSLSSLSADVDPKLESICMKCLAKDPQKRYGTAEALALDLERWLAGKMVIAAPAYPKRKHTLAVVGFAALTLIALAIALAWQLEWPNGSVEPAPNNALSNSEVALRSEIAGALSSALDHQPDNVPGTRDIPEAEEAAIAEARRTSRPLTNADFNAGLDGWHTEGDARSFKIFMTHNVRALSTHGKKRKEAVTGRLYQCFKVPNDVTHLSFKIHGGGAAETIFVALWTDGRLHRKIGAGNDNTPFSIRWNVTELRGKVVTLEVVDKHTGPWGFIGVQEFALIKSEDEWCP